MATSDTLSPPMTPLEAINTRMSQHALERMRNRGNMGMATDLQIAARLREMLSRSVEQKLKPGYSVLALLNHDFKDARYFRFDKWILVVEDETLVTVHTGEARRWEPLKIAA